MTLDHLWAGWRSRYIDHTTDGTDDGCVFCGILASDAPESETFIVWRSELVTVMLNAYPYTSGHVLVMPVRHMAEFEELDAAETSALWAAVTDAMRAIKTAYRPGGLNMGANIGRGAGAGIPGHLHVHALPRWPSDTNFITAVADTRVMPEPLSATWQKLRDAWAANAT